MKLTPAPLAGMWTVQTRPSGDERGSFRRLFCSEAFAAIRPDLRFVQVNLSITAQRGTVRGLHFQTAAHAEAKLIRCLRGRVYDVAVDLRAGSPTFGQWHAMELGEDNELEVFIPEGCAHGFQALTDDAQLLYQHTAAYAPQAEGGIAFDDPDLGIAWPLPATLVSERDRGHPRLRDIAQGVIA